MKLSAIFHRRNGRIERDNSPRLYDAAGKFRGNLNTNTFDPNSVSNSRGRFGRPRSPESVSNLIAAGSATQAGIRNSSRSGWTVTDPRSGASVPVKAADLKKFLPEIF